MEKIVALKDGYVIISKSKNKKFKVTSIGKNGEVLSSSELLESKRNAEKNIMAQLKTNHGEFVIVKDTTEKEEKYYRLNSDGTKQDT